MKKRILNVLITLLIFACLIGFFYINNLNYIKNIQLKNQIVIHPELLPNKQTAKYTSFGFSNLRADIYWLETIQYIGGNAISSDYKKYLYSMLDLITELNPFFEKPYLIGQLLLPNYNERYENLSLEERQINNSQAEKIGLKGIVNFCDEKKINLIKDENDLSKIWTDEKYKNPCKTANIPFSQAFLYYYYLKNPLASANFYKVSSANTDGLEGSKIMAAIMSGKAGNRERSIMMFLTLADSLKKKDDKVCEYFSNELQRISFQIFRNSKDLTGGIIKNIQFARDKNFKFDEKKEQEIVSGDNCENYINKAIRELNLEFLERANKKYFDKNKTNAINAKILYEKGFIDFLPTDFQQYKDYGIIYIFDKESGNFDYEMGNY
ncbi:MAG: hypothetical protein PHE25_00310 [Candidatus Gracilibacteria bacterium]|nr:hypothetical protein [Candidatus Gracilibacteria bacterium]